MKKDTTATPNHIKTTHTSHTTNIIATKYQKLTVAGTTAGCAPQTEACYRLNATTTNMDYQELPDQDKLAPTYATTWDQGYNSYLKNQPKTNNPHKHTTNKLAWQDGWHAAQQATQTNQQIKKWNQHKSQKSPNGPSGT